VVARPVRRDPAVLVCPESLAASRAEEGMAVSDDNLLLEQIRAMPPLGEATTRQLLEEVRARGQCEHYYRQEGDEMAIGAANLIDRLPGSMLDYRTVGGG